MTHLDIMKVLNLVWDHITNDLKQFQVLYIVNHDSPLTSNWNVHAVMPGMGETFPVLALHVYSPASESSTSERLSMDCVVFPTSPIGPPSLFIMTLLSVRFCKIMPFLSQTTSGGGEPSAAHVSSRLGVNSVSNNVPPWNSVEPFTPLVTPVMFGLTAHMEDRM